MKKYQLVLELENNYIVLEDSKNKEVIEYMLKWYTTEKHKQFFNGEFKIKEV